MTSDKDNSASHAKFEWPRPFSGLRNAKLSDLPREISAGITLAALMIPLNIGYAQVAGLPPVVGLYAAIIPLCVFALLTSSRNVVTSPDASIAALVGSILIGFAAVGDTQRLEYALALAMLCSVFFFLFWYFRLAFLANFLSRAVLVGFITGLGIEVFTNQTRKIMAATGGGESQLEEAAVKIQQRVSSSIETEGYFVELLALVESIPSANLYSVAIGVGALVIVRILKRYLPKVPGALVALVLLTTTVALFNLDERGVKVLGEMKSGLPSLGVPQIPFSDWLSLIPGALAVVAITMCEGLLLVRRYSQKYHYKADGNQVMFAYGAANMAAGLSGALLTGNSPSRTAAMDSAGSRSQVPSLVAACVVTLVMLFFTELLAYLPQAALAGIVANAVLSLIEVKALRALWQLRRSEFWIAVVCLLSVLALGPLKAVAIAFLLSTIDVVRRASKPSTWLLKESEDGSHFVPTDLKSSETEPGLIIYRFDSPLYFANASLFLEQIEELVSNAPSPVKWFVLDAQAVVDIDTTGSNSLSQTMEYLERNEVVFGISRASDELDQLLQHYELSEFIDAEMRFPTNRHAIEAFRTQY